MKGYLFYLNGIGVAGQNGIPAGLVKNDWALFAPRVGFAYDLTGGGKTVVRGGFGIMYERIQGNDVYNAGPNIPFSSSVTLNNVALANPNQSILTGQTVAAPITAAGITGLAYTDYKNPASYQYSMGVQHQFGQDSLLSVAYVGNQNRHQNDYRETNLPSPTVLPSLIAGTVNFNTVVPYAGFNSIRLSEDAENSHYNALQIDYHARIRNDLTLQFAYTLSRAIDPVFGNNNGDLANVSDPYNRAYDNGPSNFDRTHIALVDFDYKIPFLKNSSNHFAKTVVGGWEFSGVVTMESGLPLNINLGGPQGANGLPNSTNRPDFSGSVTYPETVTQWMSTSAFSLPASGAWGNLPKGSIRGPGRDNWDLSLFKNFVFNEARGTMFELRFESFNTFNHTQFNAVSSTFSNSNFGQVTSAWDPRVFQLGAKLYF